MEYKCWTGIQYDTYISITGTYLLKILINVDLGLPGTSSRISDFRVILRRLYTVSLPGCLEPDILRSVPTWNLVMKSFGKL
jgi:hypothetical protein